LVLSLNEVIDPTYANLLFRDRAMVNQYVISSRGVGTIQRNLYWPSLKRVATLLPPLPEQTAVVRFLNYAGRQIHRYIRAKQKLIKLLEEEKRSIADRAVSRGLDSNVRLKPSGVEWVGDIPVHWEVMLNQRIFKEEIRPHGGKPETQLSLSQRDGLIATRDMKERSLQTSTYENWKVTIPGDLVLNRFKAHLGVFFASSLRGIVSFHYGVFAPRRPVVSKYFELLYHTRAYRTIYAGRSNGMTVGLQNLSNQNFYSVHSIVPPLQEQEDIVAFVTKATQRIDFSIKQARREIDLILEYRDRVTADVVTGKLDVREAAARLPEKALKAEPLDDMEDLSQDESTAEDVELEADEAA
jgi:type I restriction enzyme, S subunit